MEIDDNFRQPYWRKLKNAISSGDFAILSSAAYKKGTPQEGQQYVCDYKGRKFYLSEQGARTPSDLTYFKKVLSDHKDISGRKPPILPNEQGELCLYLEVWYLGRWHKFHTPLRKGPDDEFIGLIVNMIEWSRRNSK